MGYLWYGSSKSIWRTLGKAEELAQVWNSGTCWLFRGFLSKSSPPLRIDVMNASAITSFQHIWRSESNKRRWMPVGSHMDIDISVERVRIQHAAVVSWVSYVTSAASVGSETKINQWWRGHGFCEAMKSHSSLERRDLWLDPCCMMDSGWWIFLSRRQGYV